MTSFGGKLGVMGALNAMKGTLGGSLGSMILNYLFILCNDGLA